ncbi:MFS transporter [Actinomarinicola tropica]|uniref:MFS transporter n=1 Tax=Actinomarinicola tropica TaxID=2789776 RepID=A0A5Q2RDP4_9ACTN|nr:MFS transporter [Actinomarinicola tropica]QGG94998.1 MFS transporter [Actinomarinicola tropica]
MSILDRRGALEPSPRERRSGGPRELFVLVALSLLMASMQFAMLSVALPDTVSDLDASVRWASWALSGFTMAQAVALPLLGRLSDSLGRRAVFIGGLGTFGLASLASALAPNLAVLVAARVVQGAAAGSILPSAYGVVGDAFAGPSRTKVLGLISSVMPVGAIVGPNLGGWIVEVWGWRGTFLVNVPLALVAVTWGWRRIPGASRRPGRQEVDLVGAGLLSLAVTLVMVGLTQLGDASGAGVPMIAAAGLAVGVAVGVGFVRHELRVAVPLVDVRLLRRREFAYLNGLNFLYGVCVFGMVSFIPLYVQEKYALSPSEAGVLLTPRALAMIAMSVAASMVLDASGFRRPIVLGLGALALSAGTLASGTSFGAPGTGQLVALAGVIAVLGAGLGVAGPSVNQSGLDLVPDQVAAITGLRGMFRALGGVVGTAAMAAMASRAATPAVGLEHSFVGLVGLAGVGAAMVRGIPDRPVSAGVVEAVPTRALPEGR